MVVSIKDSCLLIENIFYSNPYFLHMRVVSIATVLQLAAICAKFVSQKLSYVKGGITYTT